mmetsp:Transcript_3229/g.10932  ORF Transcript_3229/g.10932 Transcript_3229/m.10932 type:complete len:269 (+) Transcript_3229:533-1339(+)
MLLHHQASLPPLERAGQDPPHERARLSSAAPTPRQEELRVPRLQRDRDRQGGRGAGRAALRRACAGVGQSRAVYTGSAEAAETSAVAQDVRELRVRGAVRGTEVQDVGEALRGRQGATRRARGAETGLPEQGRSRPDEVWWGGAGLDGRGEGGNGAGRTGRRRIGSKRVCGGPRREGQGEAEEPGGGARSYRGRYLRPQEDMAAGWRRRDEPQHAIAALRGPLAGRRGGSLWTPECSRCRRTRRARAQIEREACVGRQGQAGVDVDSE